MRIVRGRHQNDHLRRQGTHVEWKTHASMSHDVRVEMEIAKSRWRRVCASWNLGESAFFGASRFLSGSCRIEGRAFPPPKKEQSSGRCDRSSLGVDLRQLIQFRLALALRGEDVLRLLLWLLVRVQQVGADVATWSQFRFLLDFEAQLRRRLFGKTSGLNALVHSHARSHKHCVCIVESAARERLE